ncbi:MAG: PadR family transcriptional regulator [Chloroflexota bacterium]|nr:PadR family transcriptional regulator [Chloroflexota bacterium]
MQLQRQIRKGSTPVLILSLLAEQSMYGYQIIRELEQRSEGYFAMQEGLLYPALHQMERDGLLSSEWRTIAGARRRKYYFITEAGRRVLANSVREWTTFTEQLMRMIGGHGHVEPESIPG